MTYRPVSFEDLHASSLADASKLRKKFQLATPDPTRSVGDCFLALLIGGCRAPLTDGQSSRVRDFGDLNPEEVRKLGDRLVFSDLFELEPADAIFFVLRTFKGDF